MLNLFQHLTSLEDLLVLNKILNSLKITDKSPYFLRFPNDTEVMFDFNSSPNEERICGRTTQLIANSDIPPQRGRLGGVQHGWCKNLSRQTSSFNTILASPFRGVLVVTKSTCSYDQCTPRGKCINFVLKLQASKNQIFVVLNLFQHLTSMEYLLVLNKILNSLKITDKSPYFLRFQNDILGGLKNVEH